MGHIAVPLMYSAEEGVVKGQDGGVAKPRSSQAAGAQYGSTDQMSLTRATNDSHKYKTMRAIRPRPLPPQGTSRQR